MNHPNEKKLNDLIRKVNQHEETIAQLVVIIAETNRRISEISSLKKQSDQHHFLTH